jgi:hypothetical protein
MLLLQALFGLLIYDVLNCLCPFKTLHSIVKSLEVTTRAHDAQSLEKIVRAVNYACAWYPKRCMCLQRSFVTTCLLRKYGITAQMVLGAQKLPFKAHAWVEVDGRAVNERGDVQSSYAVWERC